jgi:CrcB protein
MLKQILLVALGSAAGGIARFLASKGIYHLAPMKFPLPTLLVNVAGCFLIGIFFAWSADSRLMTQESRLFLTTGFCGGFTTFSAFAYENIVLMRNGAYSMVLVYITASVVLGILATFLGMNLVK